MKSILGLFLCLPALALAEPGKSANARQHLTHAGIACLPDAADPTQAIGLAREGDLTVVLANDPASLHRLREVVGASGLLGRRLFVLPGSLEAIPLADRTVDRLFLDSVAEAALTPSARAEILRVLAPPLNATFLGTLLTTQGIRKDGTELWAVELPGEPVFNGIAAADGRILLTLRDGSLLAVGGDH